MSTRIIVKNLPKNVNEDQLKKKFGEVGVLTDARLMRTKDGRSRQFAFVGFQLENEASKAVERFNNTYFNTSKISVSYAESVSDLYLVV
jgi:multiple RNA-binding domain-containing protein 1